MRTRSIAAANAVCGIVLGAISAAAFDSIPGMAAVAVLASVLWVSRPVEAQGRNPRAAAGALAVAASAVVGLSVLVVGEPQRIIVVVALAWSVANVVTHLLRLRHAADELIVGCLTAITSLLTLGQPISRAHPPSWAWLVDVGGLSAVVLLGASFVTLVRFRVPTGRPHRLAGTDRP